MTGSEDISYTYDSNNNRKEMTVGNKVTDYKYNKNDKNYKVSFTYDSFGNEVNPDSKDDAMSLHLYAYCGYDEVNAWDPSGHFWKKFRK